MPTATKTYAFTANTNAVAAQVERDFQDLLDFLNVTKLDASNIQNDAITAALIAANAVGSSEIAADAVGSSEIAANAVGSSEIAADAVGASERAAIPSCRVFKTGAQTIPDNTVTNVTFG